MLDKLHFITVFSEVHRMPPVDKWQAMALPSCKKNKLKAYQQGIFSSQMQGFVSGH